MRGRRKSESSWLARLLFTFCVICGSLMTISEEVKGLGVNWGIQASHPLPPQVVVQMLKANGIGKVKLLDVNYDVMRALANTGIEVMVPVPNTLLLSLTDPAQARLWVQNNVMRYTNAGTNIRYVAVGNEPFLQAYNDTYLTVTSPALENVQRALNSAGVGDQIKATVPFNADVLSSTSMPSDAIFRPDISDNMAPVLAVLSEYGCPFTLNIYPFLSLRDDPHFPVPYAFFDRQSSPVVDGQYIYYNVFDASYDSLLVALSKAGYGNLSIIVGEIGWPTDGEVNANVDYAQRFNQGFIDHVVASRSGTPRRPGNAIDFYMFSLIDEDTMSVDAGGFERHWGLFAYDGTAKYPLSLTGSASIVGNGNNGYGGSLAGASGVQYLSRQWCVLNENAVDRSALQDNVAYACNNADCTALGYGGSCNPYLDSNGNASYAFNAYYQAHNQELGACYFNGLARISSVDPSVGTCKFIVQLATVSSAPSRTQPAWETLSTRSLVAAPVLLLSLFSLL